LSGGLECSAHQSEDGRVEDTVDSSNAVSDPAANEATDNGAEIVLMML